ncbi:MAG: V-type ATP synthase subunit D [Pseudomonadota bacterium]
MARRLNVPPTKSALLAMRRQAAFLEQGYTLLDRKRELLTRLVYERLGTYRELRKQAEEALAEAYAWLGITHMRMGSRMLEQAGLGLQPVLDVRILPRSNLGVQYPSVSARRLPLQPVSLLWSDSSFDEARIRLADVAEILASLGEAEMALRRVLQEQRKTQKRVNALKYNIIPRYRETIRYIESALEEEERSTLFQIKVLTGA